MLVQDKTETVRQSSQRASEKQMEKVTKEDSQLNAKRHCTFGPAWTARSTTTTVIVATLVVSIAAVVV